MSVASFNVPAGWIVKACLLAREYPSCHLSGAQAKVFSSRSESLMSPLLLGFPGNQ
jgi:hypothetical protein